MLAFMPSADVSADETPRRMGHTGVFWVPTISGSKSEAEVAAMVDDVAAHGMNNIYVEVFEQTKKAQGNLVCADEAEPEAIRWRSDWGQVLGLFSLRNLIEQAHQRGLRVYVVVPCFKSDDVDPSDVGRQAFLLNTVLPYFIDGRESDQQTPRYLFDGVVLDFIRYGKHGQPNALYVTDFVARVNAKYLSTPLGACISAWPDMFDAPPFDGNWLPFEASLKNAIGFVGQDWVGMAPYLDFMLPMTYAGGVSDEDPYKNDLEKIRGYVKTATEHLRTAVSQAGANCRVISGVKTWSYSAPQQEKSATTNSIRASLAGLSAGNADGFFAFRYCNDLVNQPTWMDALLEYAQRAEELLFDDFNGLRGQALDASKWVIYRDTTPSGSGWGDPGGDVYLDGSGWAQIHPAPRWTGAGFYTAQTFQHAGQYHFETAVQFKPGPNNADRIHVLIRNSSDSYTRSEPYLEFLGPQVLCVIHPTHKWYQDGMTSVWVQERDSNGWRSRCSAGGDREVSWSDLCSVSGFCSALVSVDYNADSGSIAYRARQTPRPREANHGRPATHAQYR
jgi:hypothetical protein